MLRHPGALEEINAAIEKGLIPSELQNDYLKPITRKEFSKLVVTMIEKKSGKKIADYIAEKGLSLPDQSPFTDVNDVYVNAAYSLSIVNGIGNEQFCTRSNDKPSGSSKNAYCHCHCTGL